MFMVGSDSPGIRYHPLNTLSWDRQCEIIFDRVRVTEDQILGRVGEAGDVLERLLEQAVVAKCVEMLGGVHKAFEMTVAYAKERKQFNRPIGSFQAIPHHCANMAIDVDSACFITYQAVRKLSEGLSAGMEASMAKAWISEASRRVTRLGHQIHGAISFTDEHDMHLYYRNAKAGETAFGDADYHLEKIAQYLGM